MTRTINSTDADKLGALRAQIDILNAKAREIESRLKGLPDDINAVEGDLFRVNLVRYERKSVAWQAIAKKLGASRQLIAGNTSYSLVTKIDVRSKRKLAEAA